jgi:hypothetical protein
MQMHGGHLIIINRISDKCTVKGAARPELAYISMTVNGLNPS